MILKGKAKEDFQKWFRSKYKNHDYMALFTFYKLHFLSQYGVIEAWLNLNGLFPNPIDCVLEENNETDDEFHSVVRTHEKWFAIDFHETKIECQKQCIETAIEMYNENHKNIINGNS